MESDPYYLMTVPEITLKEGCEKVEIKSEPDDAALLESSPKERGYPCPVCFKTFTRNEHVHRHMLTHSGARPFKCTMCVKDFSRNEHLQRHMMIHTGQKPHACEICGKRFSRSEHKKRHEATHVGETPLNSEVTIRTVYRCDVCERKFSRCDFFKKHQVQCQNVVRVKKE